MVKYLVIQRKFLINNKVKVTTDLPQTSIQTLEGCKFSSDLYTTKGNYYNSSFLQKVLLTSIGCKLRLIKRDGPNSTSDASTKMKNRYNKRDKDFI